MTFSAILGCFSTSFEGFSCILGSVNTMGDKYESIFMFRNFRYFLAIFSGDLGVSTFICVSKFQINGGGAGSR